MDIARLRLEGVQVVRERRPRVVKLREALCDVIGEFAICTRRGRGGKAPDGRSGFAGCFDLRSMKWAPCTNMPPEPQTGSSTRPWSGSMTLTMVWTSATGVKNSPPSCAFWSANWVRKYS